MRHHAADDRTVEESGGDARTMRGYRGIEGKPLGKILNVALALIPAQLSRCLDQRADEASWHPLATHGV
jgi:hypothetical protein